MKLLLDTHIALWAISGDAKLSSDARRRIAEAESVSISAVAIWEIAIKHALRQGRHDDMVISGTQAQQSFKAAGYEVLPVTAVHAAAIDALPRLHGDPFDRMLVAQALTEPMHLLTRDARLKGYGALVTAV